MNNQGQIYARASGIGADPVGDSGQAVDFHGVPILAWECDVMGDRRTFNGVWLSWRGRRSDEESGQAWSEGIHDADRSHYLLNYRRLLAERVGGEAAFRMRRSDGEYRCLLEQVACRFDSQGDFIGLVGAAMDITDRSRVSCPARINPGPDWLPSDSCVYQVAIEGCPQGMVVADSKGQIVLANDAAKALVHAWPDGFEPAEGDEILSVRSAAGEVAEPQAAPGAQARYVRVTGGLLRMSGHGEPIGSVTIVADVTEMMREAECARRERDAAAARVLDASERAAALLEYAERSQTQVEHALDSASTLERRLSAAYERAERAYERADAADRRSRTDDLTGLVNRVELGARLRAIVRRPARLGTRVAIAFCDLDDFKSINDRFGHAAGDEVLRRVADRMVSTVRAGDVVARVAGDELVVIMDKVEDLADAVHVAEKLMVEVSMPITLAAATVTPTLSIGIALVRADEEPEDAVHRADAAMYGAKKAGRNRFAIAD